MNDALLVRNLCKSFGDRKALDDVTLQVRPGEMVALIGSSGSGKSTLLRHVPGFVAADSGEVVVEGWTMQSGGRVSPRIRHHRRRVGMVFQQFNLVGRLPVIVNVMTALLPRCPWWQRALFSFTRDDRRRALQALASVGIEHTAWQRASTLSGGQQQRAAIARCVLQDASLILADEPIASLDPESSRRVMALLAQLNRDLGRTVLVSLHQVEYAVRWCPRTVALRDGRVVYDGPSSALTPALLDALYGASGEALRTGARPIEADTATASIATVAAS